jgi:hypothetical protein
LRWFLGPDGNRLYLLWRETGGPAVRAAGQGTGSHLLRAQPGIEAVDLMFDPKGLVRNADHRSPPRRRTEVA